MAYKMTRLFRTISFVSTAPRMNKSVAFVFCLVILQAVSVIESASIDDALNEFNAYLEQGYSTAPAKLASIFQNLQVFVHEIPYKIANGVIPYVKTIVAKLFEGEPNITAPEVDSITTSAEAIIKELKTVLSALGNLPNTTQVANLIASMPATLTNNVQTYVQKVIAAIQSSSSNSTPLEGITQAIGTLLSKIPSILSGIGSTLSEVAAQLAQNAAAIVSSILANVKTALADLSAGVSIVGADVLSKANEAVQKVTTALSNLSSKASTAGTNSLPLQSLLTTVGTITRQVTGAINTLQTSATTIAQSIQTQAQTLSKNSQTNINTLATNTSTALNSTAAQLNTQITAAINSGKTKAQDCAEDAQNSFYSVVQSTTSAISTCAENSQSQANTVLQGAQSTTVTNLNNIAALAQELSRCVLLYKGVFNTTATDETVACLNTLNTNVQASTAEAVLTSVKTALTSAITSLPITVQTCGNAAIASAKSSIASIGTSLSACIV